MINSGELTLALTGNQPLMLIVGSSIALLIVIYLCFKAMSRPVPGYHAEDESMSVVEAPAAVEPIEPAPVETKRSRTPGFTLPLPSDVSQARAPLSPPVPQSTPPSPAPAAMDAARLAEQTIDMNRAAARAVAPPVLSQVGSAPNAYRYSLVFLNGAREGENVRLDSYSNGECGIGRSDVPENQIVIRDDLKITRVRHAIIVLDGPGRHLIKDNNSANKVFVNEQCIESAPVPLNNGDRIRIGLTELEYLREPVS